MTKVFIYLIALMVAMVISIALMPRPETILGTGNITTEQNIIEQSQR